MIFFAGWQGNYTVWSMKEIPNYNGSIGDSISSIPTLGISNALSITYNDDTSVSINNVMLVFHYMLLICCSLLYLNK